MIFFAFTKRLILISRDMPSNEFEFVQIFVELLESEISKIDSL